MDNQQRPTEEHRELCSVLCARLGGSGAGGRMGPCMCMAESLHCSLQTTTTLFIGYTPIQSVFGVKKKKKESFVKKKKKKQDVFLSCFHNVKGRNQWKVGARTTLAKAYVKRDPRGKVGRS